MKNKSLIAALALYAVAGALALINQSSAGAVPPVLLQIIRWAGVAALCGYGLTKRTSTTWILIFMVVGANFGHDWPKIGINARLFSVIFLRLIKCLIAPLIVSMLVTGIARHTDLKKTGRMGIKALIYFEIATTIALFVGLAAINISKAGVGIHLPKAEAITVAKVTGQDLIVNAFPENIAKSVAEGQTLQIVVFSLFFGIGLAMAPEKTRRPVLEVLESVAAGMFKFTKLVMMYAPIGVGAAITVAVAHSGIGVFVNLAKLILTFAVCLVVFALGVLLPVALLFKVPVRRFIKAAIEPVLISTAATSSEAGLPLAIENLGKLGVSQHAIGLILPTSYTFNLDGSCLYQTVACIFVAQAAGIHLSIGQQLFMVFTLMLATKGIANVPRTSLVILLATVTQFGLPTEAVFILLGIDELMDMGRTFINQLGNCLATVVVANSEGEFQLTPEDAAYAAIGSGASSASSS
jgi:proton glutamate symport protein